MSEDNEIFSNYYQYSARGFTTRDRRIMDKFNTITGEVEVCSNCNIF